MKKLIICILTLAVSFAHAGHGVERDGLVIAGAQELNPEILNYLQKNIQKCSIEGLDNVFNIEKIDIVSDRVDNGIVDQYYTIDLKYDAVRNDQLTNAIRVRILDSAFHNWKTYEDKLSFEIEYDQNNFCN